MIWVQTVFICYQKTTKVAARQKSLLAKKELNVILVFIVFSINEGR